MTKATLRGGQVGAAVLAGIFGHLLFAGGWIILALSLLGGTILAILGGTVKDAGDTVQIFGAANGIVLGLVIAAAVLIIVGFVVSGLILRGGKVRAPWRVTITAVIIAAIVDIPVIAAYLAITRATDGSFILISLIGTLVIGVLVWLWMTWAHRGPAEPEVIAVPAPAKPADPSIDVKRD